MLNYNIVRLGLIRVILNISSPTIRTIDQCYYDTITLKSEDFLLK